MIEGQHKKAAEHLKALGVEPAVVEEFKKDGTVYLLDLLNYGKIGTAGLIHQKIRQIERGDNVVVYGAICTQMYFGYTVNFLVTSPYKEDWPQELVRTGEYSYRAYAYCWNTAEDYLSEFGMIGISSVSGTLDRIT